MATHSSILAWRIPGTGEPGGLPFMGSHRVRHDWSDLAAVAATYGQQWAKSLQSCPSSVWPHKRQPTRLSSPRDSPGKNTGMGCHFLFQCMKVKSQSEVAQSCPTSQPHGLQPTRLLRPWDFPGKSTGVGCHCLLQGYSLRGLQKLGTTERHSTQKSTAHGLVWGVCVGLGKNILALKENRQAPCFLFTHLWLWFIALKG